MCILDNQEFGKELNNVLAIDDMQSTATELDNLRTAG
jgi:hypothetical protein